MHLNPTNKPDYVIYKKKEISILEYIFVVHNNQRHAKVTEFFIIKCVYGKKILKYHPHTMCYRYKFTNFNEVYFCRLTTKKR